MGWAQLGGGGMSSTARRGGAAAMLLLLLFSLTDLSSPLLSRSLFPHFFLFFFSFLSWLVAEVWLKGLGGVAVVAKG